ncbi:MAG: sulfate permease [Alphaproteobacteria bacterium]|nr:sulfate permease [Alphaproteobacteria bacterium]
MSSTATRDWHLFVPKLYVALKEGYSLKNFQADAIAGLTVAIVALPLSMALAIASGVPPERGLYTAIIGGFLISALGGVRQQIGGPAGAFVVVVANIVNQHGYDGLVIATIMAGLMLVAAGLLRFGTYIKYIPHPVVTGFTSGIAVIIFTSQVGEVLGLRLENVPADVLGKWMAYAQHIARVEPVTMAIAAGALLVILALRRYRPAWPGFLIAIVLAAIIVAVSDLQVETIGTRFGGIPSTFPAPALPSFSGERLAALVPSAFTIAFLAGIESLLCAVVADGMTGRRHRSNLELVAQGVANVASVTMGGIPATGTIARTATNIRAGATSPVAGMLHSAFILVAMLFLAPFASYLPLASLGAVLIVVAWNMSEVRQFRELMKAPVGERLVLLSTFLLTVFVDLTAAIEVGMVMAAFLFMHRMAKAVEIGTGAKLIDEDIDDFAAERPDALARQSLPPDIEVFQINGPFFFGAANRLSDVLDRMRLKPRVFILRMGRVPLIDASGVHALRSFIATCHRHGTRVMLSGVKPAVGDVIAGMGLEVEMFKNLERALKAASL